MKEKFLGMEEIEQKIENLRYYQLNKINDPAYFKALDDVKKILIKNE